MRIHRDDQAKIFFQMLYRLYGKDQIAKAVSVMDKFETLAHKAARSGLYSLLIDEIIGELGFDIDFWHPTCRLTVIN